MRSGIVMEKQFVRMKSNIASIAIAPTRSAHPALWLVTWDPSQPTATRPLASKKTARGLPTVTTSRKTSAKSSVSTATSARRIPTRPSAPFPPPATSRNLSNGLRSTTIPNSTSPTTTTATIPPPSAASSPATQSPNGEVSTSMPS